MINNTKHLCHYYEKTCPPFRTITSLPFDEAATIVRTWRGVGEVWVNNFLDLRYHRDKNLRDKFIAIGGKPVLTAPVYFTLGENKGMTTWYNNAACIKIPVSEFDFDTVSFTYGDNFAVFNPNLNTGEEYWGNIYKYDGILKLIDKYGFPEDPEYHMGKRIFPQEKPINHYLKYIEAHVWNDDVLDKYRGI